MRETGYIGFFMKIVLNIRLAPIFLALVLLFAGCGLRITDTANPSGSGAADQPVSGGLVAGAPAWKAMPSPTLTRPPAATGATAAATVPHSPTLIPSLTASSTPFPTETLVPLALDPGCLVGSWEAANLAQAMAESIPMAQGSLVLEGVEGQVQYLFGQDGTLQIQYHQLAAVMTGLIDSREARVVQTLNGSGTARYQVDPRLGEILLSDFGGDGITSSLSINGQVLAEGSLPVWLAFAAGSVETDPNASPPEMLASRAAAFCQGDVLTIQAIEPLPGPAVNLFRMP